MTDIIVRAEIPSFRRVGRPIFADVSLTIRKGEHWALIGPNGSGKTTLLRVLCGYDFPSVGSVQLFDLPRADKRELRKRIGMVSSTIDTQISREWSARSSVLDVVLSGIDASIGLWREFDDSERARAREALAAVNAHALEQARYDTLSQGETQRVLIARALIHRPALLILDEACAGLDPVARERFLRDLGVLAARSDAPTIVFVTHHLEEVAPFVDHALLLGNGRAIATGPIDEVFTDAHFTEAFGAPCEIRREDGRYALRVRA